MEKDDSKNKIWRVHLFCDTDIFIEGELCRKHCIDKSIVGLGWNIDNDDSSVKALKEMKLGDYIWVRNKGQYFIGKICDECAHEFSSSFDRNAKDDLKHEINSKIMEILDYDEKSDIMKLNGKKLKEKKKKDEIKEKIEHHNYESINVHRCVEKWYPCENYQVPGKVINNFISGKTVNGVSDDLLKYCEFLYKQQEQKEQGIKITKVMSLKSDEKFKILKDLLHPEDTEDLLGIWLQVQRNYIVFPSTNKQSTKDYEYVLKKKNGSKRAIIQCKTGDDCIDLEVFDKYKGEYDIYFFLFDGSLKRNGYKINPRDENILEITNYRVKYREKKNHQIYQISLEYLLAWAKDKHKDILTDHLRHYLDITGY